MTDAGSGLETEYDNLTRLGGHVGSIAAGVFFAVRLYRLPMVQPFVPEKLRWANLPGPAKYGLLLGLSGLGGALASLATDISWVDAAKAALAAMFTAVTSDTLITSGPAHAVARVVLDMKTAASPIPDTGIREQVPSLPPAEPPK